MLQQQPGHELQLLFHHSMVTSVFCCWEWLFLNENSTNYLLERRVLMKIASYLFPCMRKFPPAIGRRQFSIIIIRFLFSLLIYRAADPETLLHETIVMENQAQDPFCPGIFIIEELRIYALHGLTKFIVWISFIPLQMCKMASAPHYIFLLPLGKTVGRQIFRLCIRFSS